MIERLRGPLCTLVLAALYGAVSRDIPVTALLCALALLPALLPWRARPGRYGEGVLSFALLGLAALLVKFLPDPPEAFRGLLGPWVPFLVMASVMLTSLRLLLADPVGGDRVTVLHGLGGLVCCGSHRAGGLYLAASLLYLALAASFLRPGARPWALGKHRGVWALLLLMAAAMAAAMAWATPRAHAWVVRLIDMPQIGFQDGPLELGSLDGLAQSDRVVARLFQFRGDPLLRGAVYRDYGRGRWLGSPGDFPRVTEIDTGHQGSVEVRLEQVDVPRFFVPLAARDIRPNTPRALIDSLGVLAPVYGSSPRSVRYEPGPRDRFAPSPPEPVDLSLPSSIRPFLTDLALRWVGQARSPEEKLAHLEAGLVREHRYALHFERPARREPLVAFLEQPGSAGHCEYFASSLALLARAVGLPARLIAGYRVSEYNTVGGYHVLRERNAHAWVEVHLPQRGWVSVDPSPAASESVAGPAETPWLSAWLDAVSIHAGAWLRVAVENPRRVALVLGPVAAFIILRDAWRRYRGRATRRPDRAAPEAVPLPCLATLLRALEQRGIRRASSESIEALARRIDEGHGPAASLLRRYAALRYGGQGDEAQLSRDIDDYLASGVSSGLAGAAAKRR